MASHSRNPLDVAIDRQFIASLASRAIVDGDDVAMSKLAEVVLDGLRDGAEYVDGWGRIYRRMRIHLHAVAVAAGVTAGVELEQRARRAAQRSWNTHRDRIRREQAADDRFAKPLSREELAAVIERLRARFATATSTGDRS